MFGFCYFKAWSKVPEDILAIEIHLGVDRMCVGFFPFADDFSDIGVGDFFINHGVFKRIGSVFGEEKIDNNAHENVENEDIGVGVFEDHESGSEKDPNNDHEGNHRDDFLDHAHVRTALFIFVKHGQSVAI